MSGTRQNSKNTKFDKNRKSSHEQIDVILSKFRRFTLNLLRNTHILKIIQMKKKICKKQKRKKKMNKPSFLKQKKWSGA